MAIPFLTKLREKLQKAEMAIESPVLRFKDWLKKGAIDLNKWMEHQAHPDWAGLSPEEIKRRKKEEREELLEAALMTPPGAFAVGFLRTPKVVKEVPKGLQAIEAAIETRPKFFAKLTKFPLTAKEILPKLEYELTDRFAPLRRFVRQVEQISGKQVPLEENPYVGARLFAGRFGIVKNAFDELREITEPVRKYSRHLTNFMFAERNIERWKRGIKSPVSLEDSQLAIQEIKEIMGKNFNQITKTAEAIHKWSDKRILKPLLDAQIISRKSYLQIKKLNRKWLPYDVLEYLPKNADNIPAGQEIFSVGRQGLIRKMIGTTKEIRDPFETMIDRLVQTVDLVERNKVALQIINLRKLAPEMKAIIRPIPKRGIPIPRDWDTMNVFIKGKAQRFAIPEELGEAIRQFTPAQGGLLTDIGQKTASAFRAGATTLYLPFTLSNAIRDAYMAKIASRYNFGIRDWVKGFVHGLSANLGFPTQLYRDYLEAKGGFAAWTERVRGLRTTRSLLFESKLKKTLSAIINPFEWFARFSNAIELAPRLGTFARAGRYTSKLGAAYEARQVTIDFARAGRLLKVWNQFVPFLNARVQGKLNLFRAFRERPIRSAFYALTYAAIPGTTAYLYNRLYYSDFYDDIPRWIRDNYYIIIYGTEIDEETGHEIPKMLTIPKGDVGQLFSNPIENFLDFVYDKEPRTIQRLATSWLSDAVSPIEFAREGRLSATKLFASTLPPLLRTPMEIAVNRSFYLGYPIVPRRLERIKPEEQYTKNTSQLAIRIGQKLGISPIKLEYALGGMFAGMGREMFNPIEILQATKERFIRARGGERENLAWESVDMALMGYNTTRLRAERLFKEGKIKEAWTEIQEWNEQVDELIEDLSKVSGFNKVQLQRFKKSIYFDASDIERIRVGIAGPDMSALERTLRIEPPIPSELRNPIDELIRSSPRPVMNPLDALIRR